MQKCSICSRQMTVQETCSCGATQWSNFDNLISSDTEVLDFIYARMTETHREDNNVDYMIKFKDIINTIKTGLHKTV